MLTEMEERLSVVERWSIVATIQKQTVAAHSFNVALIARRIAIEWFGVHDADLLYNILLHALYHDQVESVIGDPPSIAKAFFDEKRAGETYRDKLLSYKVHDEAEVIVKMADKMEALHFMHNEILMGNTRVAKVFEDVATQLLKSTRHYVRPQVLSWLEYIRNSASLVDPLRRA